MDVDRGMTGSPAALVEGRVSFPLQSFYWPLFVSLFFFRCHSVSLLALDKSVQWQYVAVLDEGVFGGLSRGRHFKMLKHHTGGEG